MPRYSQIQAGHSIGTPYLWHVSQNNHHPHQGHTAWQAGATLPLSPPQFVQTQDVGKRWKPEIRTPGQAACSLGGHFLAE